MNKKPTLTVGIPAYNEEANIGILVKTLLGQDEANYTLNKIIVYSDGSDDSTADIANSIKDPKIFLIDSKNRQGLPNAQMHIIKNTEDDILVILNADTRPKYANFLAKLVEPIVEKGAHLTSGKIEEIPTTSFIGRIATASNIIKNYICENYKNGDNIYTCKGAARAFSKKLYPLLNFRNIIAEDAYSYLECKAKKMKYCYVKDAMLLYNPPENLKDHIKQSTRFFTARKQLNEYFDPGLVSEEYRYPLGLAVLAVLKAFIKHPILIFTYCLIVCSIKVKTIFIKAPGQVTWDIAKSTKVLEEV